MKYIVYQQRPPIMGQGRDGKQMWTPNVEPVDTVDARSGAEAIAKAKAWPLFRAANGLARFPIVASTASLEAA